MHSNAHSQPAGNEYFDTFAGCAACMPSNRWDSMKLGVMKIGYELELIQQIKGEQCDNSATIWSEKCTAHAYHSIAVSTSWMGLL